MSWSSPPFLAGAVGRRPVANSQAVGQIVPHRPPWASTVNNGASRPGRLGAAQRHRPALTSRNGGGAFGQGQRPRFLHRCQHRIPGQPIHHDWDGTCSGEVRQLVRGPGAGADLVTLSDQRGGPGADRSRRYRPQRTLAGRGGLLGAATRGGGPAYTARRRVCGAGGVAGRPCAFTPPTQVCLPSRRSLPGCIRDRPSGASPQVSNAAVARRRTKPRGWHVQSRGMMIVIRGMRQYGCSARELGLSAAPVTAQIRQLAWGGY